MTVKEYIAELKQRIATSGGEWKAADEFRLEGAETVISIQKEEARKRTAEYAKMHPDQPAKWREKNREAYNAYHREYRKRKKKQKGVDM